MPVMLSPLPATPALADVSRRGLGFFRTLVAYAHGAVAPGPAAHPPPGLADAHDARGGQETGVVMRLSLRVSLLPDTRG